MRVELTLIDIDARAVVDLAGRTLPILAMFDGRGLPCTTSAEAVIVFAGLRGGRVFLRLRPYERRGLQ